MLVEGFVVLYRALRSDHRVLWAEGKDGAPRQMSPFLDNLGHSLNDRGVYRDDADDQKVWETQTGSRRGDAFSTDSQLLNGMRDARGDYRRR